MECIGKHNSKLKEACALKRSGSKKSNEFLLEGFREIYRALVCGYECVRLFCHPEVLDKELLLVNEIRRRSIETHFCREETLKLLSYKQHPDHFVAVMKKQFLKESEFLIRRKNPVPFYLIIEQIEKPGNVGALLRIADAAGIDGVILCDPMIDLFNPNLIRASLGTVFSVPVLVSCLENVFDLIKREEWQVFVTSPSASAMYYTENFCIPTALVFGSEKDGVTESWLKAGFPIISLPMFGLADSLNLSTAVSAITYEVVRQRLVNNKNISIK